MHLCHTIITTNLILCCCDNKSKDNDNGDECSTNNLSDFVFVTANNPTDNKHHDIITLGTFPHSRKTIIDNDTIPTESSSLDVDEEDNNIKSQQYEESSSCLMDDNDDDDLTVVITDAERDIYERIDAIRAEARVYEERITHFLGSLKHLPYFELNEKFLNCLIALSEVDCHANGALKEKKELTVRFIELCQEKLRAKAEGFTYLKQYR